MVIDGKEIVFFQKKNDVSKRYYDIVLYEVKKGIREISFVTGVRGYIAKTTDSFYFEVNMNNVNEPFYVSVRTHGVKEKKKNYIYVSIPSYDNMYQLVRAIQNLLVNRYNSLAMKSGLKEAVMPKSRKEVEPLKNLKKKKEEKRKLRGTKNELLAVQNESFESFISSFDKKEY